MFCLAGGGGPAEGVFLLGEPPEWLVAFQFLYPLTKTDAPSGKPQSDPIRQGAHDALAGVLLEGCGVERESREA